MIAYKDFIRRNHGYIDEALQDRIRRTRVLIAGCGVGSSVAETAIRTGFESVTLADADTVAAHNLNRQCFTADDVGRPKVTALKRRLNAIYPSARVSACNDWISGRNVRRLVASCDLVIDTVDFLDLSAIVALHDEAGRQGKPVISALSAGFGAAAVYFPVGCPVTFRELFDIPAKGPVDNLSYVEKFSKVMTRLADVLDPTVVKAIARALTFMEDDTPCPAPHLAIGAAAVAALVMTIAVRALGGQPVPQAPAMIVDNLVEDCVGAAVNLS